MKFLVACLFIFGAVKAADWANIRPFYKTRPGLRPVISSRIIGGEISEAGQFPYQAGITIDLLGFCGGSLIAPNVILTAGHCVKGSIFWEVVLGAQKINNNTEPNRQTFTTRNRTLHEGYDETVINNDIAILVLNEDVEGPGISPVRLPSRSQVSNTFEGVPLTVSGWGRTNDWNPFTSNELRFVEVTGISNALCAEYYGIDIINESKLCIDTLGGSEGTCNGDSGGPLVFYEDDGLPTEVGIVSFGSSAGCESGAPAAFTRVTEYLDWLEINAGVTIRP
ncbi:Hypothetical predicted protein [Cloeon dipterum]|uniref:Peptidase S1 domain-containing protein n=1 Tax=Cloeon dipterum TaxID=197152 RepID=A0A8S1CAF0_9INSE|nr:Hypothetical predicted protein [Cloeon dipterum]